MKRLYPATLFGQTVLLLLAGIGLSLFAANWIYGNARQEAVRTIGALTSAERIINLTRLVSEAPTSWRERILAGSSDAAFRVTLGSGRPAIEPASIEDAAAAIAEYLKQSLPGRQITVAVTMPGQGSGAGPAPYHGPGLHSGMGPGSGPAGRDHMDGPHGMREMPMRGPLARGAMAWRGLQAGVQLDDGQWLNFSTALPDSGPTMSPRLIVALLLAAGSIALLTAWAVERTTAPLRVLSNAAERLGRNVEMEPLALSGSRELQQAAGAFNDMQSRLRRLIENRTQMLAAISHDLRTQLTLLRLRAEAGPPTEDRDRMLRTIGEMEEMLSTTLSFARDDAASEPLKKVDIGALVSSMIDDMADAGLPVEAKDVAVGITLECKPMALRRAITNLIDNGVKYGGKAWVSVGATATGLEIVIDDAGPGIPEEQLAHVKQPFYRLEASRNRDTGGIGLGLAIAASIAQAHGGTLLLANRPAGGLRAAIELPR